jgi:SAM-dependent methyltransferase
MTNKICLNKPIKEGESMKDYNASTYGDKVANVYDERHGDYDAEMIERIYELAPNGSAFELGIGTGRVALPLSKRGMKVDGIDSSKSMVRKLKAKPGSKKISVQIGDFADFKTAKKYDVVFVVYNTFYGLLTQDDQISCFKSVHNGLKNEGKFVIEAFVPDPARLVNGQNINISDIEKDNVSVAFNLFDAASQTISCQLVRISEKGINMVPIVIRFAYPAEFDLLAKLTGFELSERWANWKKEPFTSNSGFHISVYKKISS